MDAIKYVLCIVLILTFGKVRGQTHIYDRYASRSDLEVAYLENVYIDSATYINATIILARDSASWNWMKEEFHIQSSITIASPQQYCYRLERLCDRQHPESMAHGDIHDCYYLCANLNRRSIIIYQFETEEQFNALIHFKISLITHEKD